MQCPVLGEHKTSPFYTLHSHKKLPVFLVALDFYLEAVVPKQEEQIQNERISVFSLFFWAGGVVNSIYFKVSKIIQLLRTGLWLP